MPDAIRRTVALIVATTLVPLSLTAQAAPTSTSSTLDERVVDSLVTAEMQQKHLVGISVALVRGGRIELAKGYGLASLQPRVPVDTGTRFSIGSVTKEFVSALLLLMQEDGRLSVNDRVSKWYPALTRAGDVTLLDLVNHVSGYRDYYPLDFVDIEMSRPTTPDAVIREYATRPLDFEPGTRWSYSNTGYTIVGRVIERVAGKPLGALLDERIFRPLGMRQTKYEPAPTERVAKGYVSWALGAPEPAPPEATGWIGAPGGIWSTASDLARWDLALMRPGFLSDSSRKVLFGERVLRDGTPTGYAAGLSTSRGGGRTILAHGGATSGFSATNMFVPADSAAVVVLSNTDQNVTGGRLLPLVSPPRQVAESAPPPRAQTPMTPPTPSGPPALQAAVALFTQLQRGRVDRGTLAADYAWFLTPARVASAARSLAPLGEPTAAEVLGVRERGGMQVATVRLRFPQRTVTTLMYRDPNGKVEQYLLW